MQGEEARASRTTLSKITLFAFDKTGTLTQGRFSLDAVDLLVVELEGGEFESNFDFGRLLKTEKSSLPVMWTGNYNEIVEGGLMEI